MISPEFNQFCEILTRGKRAPPPPTRSEACKQEYQLSLGIEEIKDPAKEFFDRGLRIVEEYANLNATQMTSKGIGGDDVYFSTYAVPINIGDEEIRFTVRAKSRQSSFENHRTPEWILPLSGPIEIFMLKERSEGWEILFHIRKRPVGEEFILHSPFRVDNDYQAMGVASELLDEIETHLSENHIPLSKQPKPVPQPRGVRKVMQVLTGKFH